MKVLKTVTIVWKKKHNSEEEDAILLKTMTIVLHLTKEEEKRIKQHKGTSFILKEVRIGGEGAEFQGSNLLSGSWGHIGKTELFY